MPRRRRIEKRRSDKLQWRDVCLESLTVHCWIRYWGSETAAQAAAERFRDELYQQGRPRGPWWYFTPGVPTALRQGSWAELTEARYAWLLGAGRAHLAPEDVDRVQRDLEAVRRYKDKDPDAAPWGRPAA